MNDQSEEFIPSEERTWNDILVNENFKGHTLESRISNLGVMLVRHHDEEERETDGVGHSKSIGPKLRDAFQRTPSLIQLGSSIFQKEAKQKQVPTLQDDPRRSVCCTLALFQDTLEGT